MTSLLEGIQRLRLRRRSARVNTSKEHWKYEYHSDVLKEKIWIVCCADDLADLIQGGVHIGLIYTMDEIKELRKNSGATKDDIKRLHQAKKLFKGTIVPAGIHQRI